MRHVTFLLTCGLVMAGCGPRRTEAPKQETWTVAQAITKFREELEPTTGHLHCEKRAVQRLGGPKKAAQRLEVFAQKPDVTERQRQDAVHLLRYCEEFAVPALVRALKSPSVIVRRQAAQELGVLRPQALDAVLALEAAVKDKDPEVQYQAASALEMIQLRERKAPRITSVIVRGGKPYPCRVLRQGEKTITVFLIETREIKTFKWEELDPMEISPLKRPEKKPESK